MAEAPFRPQSRHAHHLAGQAGQASRAKIEAEREAGKEARVAAKGKAVAEQEQQAAHEAAAALLFEPRGHHSTPPRRPTYLTRGQCGVSPDRGPVSLLLAFASEGLIGAGDAESASSASTIAPVPSRVLFTKHLSFSLIQAQYYLARAKPKTEERVLQAPL